MINEEEYPESNKVFVLRAKGVITREMATFWETQIQKSFKRKGPKFIILDETVDLTVYEL